MEQKKPGRPTDAVKETTIRLRVDKEFAESLEATAKELCTNRSELIRKYVSPHILSSKKFEDTLGLANLAQLESASQKCIHFLKHTFPEMSEQYLSENFPAFLNENESCVRVKYPTVKIKILLQSSDAEEKIKSLLSEFNQAIALSTSLSIIISKNDPQRVYLPEIICLLENLQANHNLANALTNILAANNIQYEIWPAFYLVAVPVSIRKKDEVSYINYIGE